MGELLSDCSKFIKIEFKSKHTVNQDIRHQLDIESEFCIMYGLCKILILYSILIFKQFTINEYITKDSSSFSKEIFDQDPNLFMASFNIQSLFTNIPFDEKLIFLLILFSIRRGKLKARLSDISNNYLHFMLSHLFSF